MKTGKKGGQTDRSANCLVRADRGRPNNSMIDLVARTGRSGLGNPALRGYVAVWVIGLGLLTGCKHTSREATYAPIQPMGSTAPAASVVPSDKMQAVELPRKIDPASLKPPSDLFTLGPGDRLEIEVIGDPASRTMTIVGPDGKIYFSLLPGIDVWGATLAQ